MVEVEIFLKEQEEPIIYTGDRIDVLDFTMDGTKYKQIRYFRDGSSKSELIASNLINKIVEKK